MEFKVRIEASAANPDYYYVRDISDLHMEWDLWSTRRLIPGDALSKHVASLLDARLANHKKQIAQATAEDALLDQLYLGGKA